MTLSEYLKQDNPVRKPTVLLDKSEYTFISTIKSKVWLQKNLYINGINGEYCLRSLINDNSGLKQLYTTDDHGNPAKLSVFHIRLTDEA